MTIRNLHATGVSETSERSIVGDRNRLAEDSEYPRFNEWVTRMESLAVQRDA